MIIRAFLQTTEGRQEITPERSLVLIWKIDPQNPITFDVNHVTAQATPWRLELRDILPVGAISLTKTNNKKVYYRFFDKDHQLLNEGALNWLPQISIYDYPFQENLFSAVSDPEQRFFLLPPEVAQAEFSADHPVLLLAYNRVSGMTREIRVPEDAFTIERGKRMPSWFSLRPKAWRNMRKEGKAILMIGQRRPPQPTIDWQSGSYHWQSFEPIDQPPGRYLLVSRGDNPLPLKDFARASAFIPLSKKAKDYRFISLPGRETVEPKIIFIRTESTPTIAHIELDHQPFWSEPLAGKHGEIRLPEIPPGQHTITINPTDSQSRFFINYTKNPQYTKRFSYKLQPEQTLSFQFQRTQFEKEILSGRLFLPKNTNTRAIIRVSFQQLSKEQWTP
ncbi:hypothetical protein ACQZV8_21385, partial [Magnetococcales bacterium HHB-1]